MGQGTWARNTTAGAAGRAGDGHTQAYAKVVTGRNEGSIAVFPGRFVVKGTTDEDVKIQDSGAAIGAGYYVGLAVDNENRARVQGSLATAGYAQNELVQVAETGVWYAESEEAVVKGEQVYVRFVAGAGGSIIGKVRNDADTASAEAVNATFAESAGAGIVKIELNMIQV